LSEERERVAEELRRIREQVRERGLGARAAALPPPLPAREPEALDPVAAATPPTPWPKPDGTAVNARFEARPAAEAGGLRGLFARRLRALLAPWLDAQVGWNASQVQLDNELMAYVDSRFSETHRHYDEVLGIHGRHMLEIDERHLILQEELVAHVHDLVKRIDLVLAESEQGRAGLELALRDLRVRLAALEERLGRG
jgi:hypothetical protein